MKVERLIIFLLFCVIFQVYSWGQTIIPDEREQTQRLIRESALRKIPMHTSLRPYLIPFEDTLRGKMYDSILFYRKETGSFRSLFMRKLRSESFISKEGEDFAVYVDPLFDFSYGRSKEGGTANYLNTRGGMVRGRIGSHIWFQSTFLENQAHFPDYLSTFVKANKVIPGQGQARSFESSSFDFANATGLLSWAPSKFFNVAMGQGKNFIGDGYRSLLLSDNSFNYPYLRLTTNFWKVQYTTLFTSFIDLRSQHSYAAGYKKKYGAFHYLSFFMGEKTELSLFDGVIWQRDDSTGYRGFDVNYMNPVIFYHPVQFSLGSPDNSILGLNFRYNPSKHLSLYTQWVLDDFDVSKSKKGKGFILDKYGFQGGFKYFDLFGVKNLYLQSEYNQVQPYVYAHHVPAQNYSHYNQSLTHPLGANFRESVSFLTYRMKDFLIEYQFNYAVSGVDTSGTDWGNDIFISDRLAQRGPASYGNYCGQGVKRTLVYQSLTLSWLLNPRTNLEIYASITDRSTQQLKTNTHDQWITAGIRTNLFNHYYDF
jgi:hypothetical protein